MESIIISFSADTSQLKTTLDLLVQTGKVSDADAKAFLALGEASKKAGDVGASAAKKHGEEVKKASTNLDSFASKLENLATTLGVAFGVAEVINFGKEAVKAYASFEKSSLQLLGAVKGNVIAQQQLLSGAKELGDKFAIPQSAIVEQQKFLAINGRTQEQIEKVIQAAVQLSAVTGEDLSSSVFKLNATFEGNIGRLGRLDHGFTELSKSQLENGDAIDLVLKKYQGFAEKGLEGVAGQLQRTQVELEELTVEIGKQAAPLEVNIKKFESIWLQGLNAMVQGAKDLFDKNKTILNPANWFRGANSEEIAEKNKQELKTQTDFSIKQLKHFNEEQLNEVIKKNEEILTLNQQGFRKDSALRQVFNQAQIDAARQLLDKLQADREAAAKKEIITLEKLKLDKADLESKQSKIIDPLGKGKAESEKLLQQIITIQKQIDEITGKTAEERRKAQADALKQLNEDARKFGEEALVQTEIIESKKLELDRQNKLKEAAILLQKAGGSVNDAGIGSGNLEAVKAFKADEAAINLDYDRKIANAKLKEAEEAAKKIAEINKKNADDDLQATLSTIDLSTIKQKAAITKKFLDTGNFSKEAEIKLQDDLLKVDQDANKIKIQEEIKAINLKIAAGEDIASNEEKLKQLQIQNEKEITATIDKEIAKRAAIKQANKEVEKQQITELLSATQDASNALFTSSIQDAESRRDSVLAADDAEKKSLEDKFSQGHLSRKRYDAQLKALDEKKAADQKKLDADIAEQKRKQAIANKIIALFNIAVHTAESVMTTTAELGIFGLPVIPSIIALGAIQAGIVAATPLPKFHKGRLAQLASNEEMAIIRKDETIFDPQLSKEYAPTFKAIYHKQIKPSVLNEYVNFKLKSFNNNQSSTIDTNKLAHDIAWALRDHKATSIKNVSELGAEIAKHLPQPDPRRW